METPEDRFFEQARLHEAMERRKAESELQAIPYHARLAGINTRWIRVAEIGLRIGTFAGVVTWFALLYNVKEVSFLTVSTGTDRGIAISVALKVAALFAAFVVFVAVPIGLRTACHAIRQVTIALQTPYRP